MPDGRVFVQHKGSSLCADIVCPVCGEGEHWDQDFMYAIRCPHCKATLRLGDSLSIAVADADYRGIVVEHGDETTIDALRAAEEANHDG